MLELEQPAHLRAAVSSLSGLLFGFDTTLIACALPSIGEAFGIGSFSLGSVVTLGLVGAALGSLAGGAAADRVGREHVLFLCDALFCSGSLLMALAPSLSWLLLGRLVVGMAVGAGACIVPVYLAELFRNELDDRGRHVGSNVVYITGGQFLAYLVGIALYPRWRIVLASGCVPAVIQALLLRYIHASPSGATEARQDLPAAPSPLHAESVSLSEIAKSQAIKTGCLLQALQQASGINAVMYFAPTLLVSQADKAGLTDNTRAVLVASLLPVIINVAGSWLSLRLVDRIGRRPLLLGSLAGTIVTLFLLSLAFAFAADIGVALVFLLCLFVACYSVGLGSVPWTWTSEVMPSGCRATANSITTSANWLSNVVVAAVATVFIDRPAISFALFAIVSAAGASLLANESVFPETRGVEIGVRLFATRQQSEL